MSSIHLELLDNKRKEYFKKLKMFKNRGYLAGGTALSLQIKHRYSFDFDIFFPKEIRKYDYFLLRKNFSIKKIFLNTSEQLTVLTKDNIKITLVFNPYKNLFSFIKTDFLPLSSLKDIAADKAITVGQRGRWRDYVDLFFIIKRKYLDIDEIIGLAKRKFKGEFNDKLFLEQLVYFEDLGEFDISFIDKKYSEKEIEQYLIHQVKTYQKSIIKELKR